MPKLEMPTPTGFLQAELQKAVDIVSFGIQCAEIATPSELTIPGIVSHVTPAGNKAMSIEDARAEFKSWVLGNGLRDCVEAVGPTLEWSRKHCFLWTQPGDVIIKDDDTLRLGARIRGEDWNSEIIDGAKTFEWMGLPNKLNHLNQKYGFYLPELSQHVLTINKARNCLSHRRGIVGEVDINDPSGSFLEVKWRRIEFSVKTEEGEKPLDLPASVEGGSLLQMAFVDTTKQFSIGSKVHITPEEFIEIALTFLLFALQIQESTKSMEEHRRSEALGAVGDA